MNDLIGFVAFVSALIFSIVLLLLWSRSNDE